jgi:hypothetical protein
VSTVTTRKGATTRQNATEPDLAIRYGDSDFYVKVLLRSFSPTPHIVPDCE